MPLTLFMLTEISLKGRIQKETIVRQLYNLGHGSLLGLRLRPEQ